MSGVFALTCALNAESLWTRIVNAATGRALKIMTATIPAGKVGTPYSVGFTASGGKTPYTWSLPGGSAWLTMSGATASGIPARCTAPGATVTVQVRDRAGKTVLREFALIVRSDVPLEIVSATLPDGRVGVPYTYQFQTVGGCQSVY